jgi:predicted ribosome quality control (RQC) complex YloA/Tae2 family protein
MISATKESSEQLEAQLPQNLSGMRKEVQRQYLRAIKKADKAANRLASASQRSEVDAGTVSEAETAVTLARKRVEDLRGLIDQVEALKSNEDVGFRTCAEYARGLGVGDCPPPRSPQKKKKPKGPRFEHPRKPYHSYYSCDGTEIRVGRGSSDNDILSCGVDPDLRSPRDWWMHATACPGSHVVIRCEDDDLPSARKELVLDAALLAAKNSKSRGGRVPVTMTRCRNVSKPPGAKAGLVHISGDVHTVFTDVKAEDKRLVRLTETKNMM